MTPRPTAYLNPLSSGRRRNGRARLGIPADVETVSGLYSCKIVDLSCGGAKITCKAPLRVGRSVRLRIGEEDVFADIVWSHEPAAGLLFERPLDEALIVRLRMQAPAILQEEKHRIEEYAREWVQGLIHED